MRAFLYRLRLWARKLGVRVVSIAALSVLSVFAAKYSGVYVPAGVAEKIGADSVVSLLNIIANSMLTVTTFSLSVMVTIHRNASSQWTPRAHRMHLRDSRTQTVIATFLGAYIYALLSLILLDTPYFGDKEVVALFVTTLGVIAWIVYQMLMWVLHLQTFGSLEQTADRIHEQTRDALQLRMSHPCLGGHALLDRSIIPMDAKPVFAARSGYVVRMMASALDSAAEDCGGAIYIIVDVGEHITKGDPIAFTTGHTEKMTEAVEQNIDIGHHRDIEQDPNFGLLMLAEIGEKALSPGVNDGGTAIDMIDRMAELAETHEDLGETTYKNLWMPPLNTGDIIRRPFDLISRYAITSLEVQEVLLKRLDILSRHPDPDIVKAAREVAQDAFDRAQEALPTKVDKAKLVKPQCLTG